MTAIHQQLKKEVFELIGEGSSTNPEISIYALEAACLILDHKFGKDFHKKNPKLTVKFTETIMKNIRMKDFKEGIQNDIDRHLNALRMTMENKALNNQETFMDDFAESFKF